METNKKIQALEAHLEKNPTDFRGWMNLSDEYDALFLEIAHKKHPKSIIRAPHADLISAGYVQGLGGCVPANWDGSIYDWNDKQIQPPNAKLNDT